MSILQNILLKLLPQKWARAMEAESRSWMLRCSSCGFEHSLWEAGGIRWKGTSKSATLLRCPACSKVAVHTLHREQEKKEKVD